MGSPRAPVVAMLLAAGPALAQAPAPTPPGETAAAREQARLCERENLTDGVAACRAALELGIGPARRRALREQLARHLVALEDWDALADHFRESVRLEPLRAEAWLRLGVTLLFALSEPVEALSALSEAVRLAPNDAEARLALAQALAATGRSAEARAAFEAAVALAPGVLDGRPAARATLEAVRSGASWP